MRLHESKQIKGAALGLEAATDDDRACAARFTETFIVAVMETDGAPRHLLERLVPADHVACTIAIDELFDQTPGPGAGAALPR